MIAALLGLAMVSGAEGALRFGARGPAGPGQPEPTKGAACAECQKHAPYLDTGDDCFCHASDIMTTFANDATKTLTTNSKYGSQTQQTGAADCGLRQGAGGTKTAHFGSRTCFSR